MRIPVLSELLQKVPVEGSHRGILSEMNTITACCEPTRGVPEVINSLPLCFTKSFDVPVKHQLYFCLTGVI